MLQIHNDDGVWLRLSPESIEKWCSAGSSNHSNNGEAMEAWALQYNQHLGKTLLVPVEEPKSILDEIIKETMAKRLPMRPGESGGGGGGRRPVRGKL